MENLVETWVDEVLKELKESHPYRGTDIARAVLAKRYLIKDADGNAIETPEDLFTRVAKVIAQVDFDYYGNEGSVAVNAGEFYKMMVEGRFLPNSPTLMNAGRPLGQLSACFVLPVADAISNGKDGIYDTLKSMAIIHQSGGGTGFSFSDLRARNSMVRSTTGVASGPISFMSLYDYSTEVVKQGGTRRGANMGILRVDHPDILEFIDSKIDTSKITNFNISIAVTDEFMEALERGEHDDAYWLIDHNGKKITALKATTVFDKIVRNAHATGEPGLFFIDEANRYNPVPHLGRYEATNPCGEQPLLPYDVCNLGSINVGHYVENGVFAWEQYKEDIYRAVHFLDNVIDANTYPLKEVEDLSKRIRRIGLGIMGFADALVRLGIPYNSDEGIAFGKELMAFMELHSRRASHRLAVRKGTFPEWEQSIWGPDDMCARDENTNDRIRPHIPLRNANITTIAPTGTISMIAGCSSGIEPLFAVAFYRNQADMRMVDYNEDFRKALVEQEGLDAILVDTVLSRTAELGYIPSIVSKETVETFVTAHDVDPEWHVRMQAAFQQHNDSAISKTINFPHEATVEQVREAYIQGWRTGLKGITVYRDGSRGDAPLTTGATGKKDEPIVPEVAIKGEDACPICHLKLVFSEGCESCPSCGYSACKIG